MLNKVFIFVVIHLLRGSEAVSTSIDTINGEVIVCSRDRLSLVCSHNYTSAGVTRWEVTGTPQCLVSHDPPSSTTEACGDFFITNVSDKNGPTLNSTAEIIPNASLDGVMVECRAGSSSTSKLIGNVTIRILSVPTPTIDSIKQLSQSSVKLTLSVPDDRCVGSYRVDTIADGWSNSTNSNVLPIVYVSGLNVCRFNYTFVASITTPDLVQGAESAPMSFDADLSGIPLGASDCITTMLEGPIFTSIFSLVNGTVFLRTTLENVSEPFVPTRTYRHTKNNGKISPVKSVTGKYFDVEVELPGGDVIDVFITFQDNQCRETTEATFIVPYLYISGVEEDEPMETSHTVTITLPLTSYQPEQLQIISTVDPADSATIMADYTGYSEQYSATFKGLNPDTQYRFTIRIVLNADNAVDVILAVSRNFTTAVSTLPNTEEPVIPVAEGGCNDRCVVGIVAGVIIAIPVLIVVIVVVVVILVLKYQNVEKKYSVQMEEQRYGREEIKKLPPVTEAVRTTENKEEPPEVNIEVL